ncbi:tellurite resistance TerB family protein [Frankia nepalensis]|uniref:tellurite resistance TerB family protein n=1 Tax=Frankia nepalensis TaxID=1836974 RepID=UPI00288A475A|nr:TerB family tellurite resistance protein [Frankia nepalensis]
MPPAIQLDVRLIARTGEAVLLTRRSAEAWYTLPGGPVGAAAGGARARRRPRDAPAPPAAGRWTFAGAVEHTGDAADEGASPAVDPSGESWERGTPGGRHVLTLLFATDWPDGVEVPSSWRDREVGAVSVDELVVTRLAPLPVAWATRRWLAEPHPLWRRLAPAAAVAAWSGSRPPVASLRAQLAARRDQLKGRRFRDAAVAVCALVAAADGRIDPAERDGLRAFLATDPVMTNFPADELEQLFEAHVAALATDADAARREILADLAKLRGRTTEATAVLRLGEVIGRIDGAFPPVEQAVLVEAAGALGLDPAQAL